MKSLDLTRLIGNLTDNAFDEVLKYPEDERFVELHGALEGGRLVFTITNTAKDAKALSEMPLFASGYTTKNDGGHQGLGLSIVKSIVENYKGSITVQASRDDRVSFVIEIPN
ncbi:sensor histidine kinase [Paenibacillus tarimensis]|uniref:sensor histidine kinase n=1 Tax=Paenibacillus tarimensis TaxID=416012 RepID=UPI001F176B7A|nr:GHKL domain-containing protein [Paenibacillus tarimensis]MCF2943055.1 GHKL domain-containing protein [Paenibacillus tarimensis]